jgi:hypothetical protein
VEPEVEYKRGRPGTGCAFVIGVNAVLAVVVVLVFWVIGSTLDQTRSGVLVENGRISVVSAVCPGERLEAVRLYRIGGTEEQPEQQVIWEIEGDGAFPERFDIGAELPGLSTVVPLFETISDSDELVFRLRSNQLQSVDAFGFVPGEMGIGQVASVPAFTDRAEDQFRMRALEATPCE